MSGREVVIKYLGNVHIRVQGRATSRIYEFSVQRPINPVDARDAHAPVYPKNLVAFDF